MRGEGEGGRQRQRAGLWLDVASFRREGGGGDGGMKEREEGEQCAVVHCGPAAPAALPLCCLAHPASGRQPITVQGSSATSVQCVRANREEGGEGGEETQRCKEDERREQGERKGSGMKEADGGERDERRGRKWEEAERKEGEADSSTYIPANPTLLPAPLHLYVLFVQKK